MPDGDWQQREGVRDIMMVWELTQLTHTRHWLEFYYLETRSLRILNYSWRSLSVNESVSKSQVIRIKIFKYFKTYINNNN